MLWVGPTCVISLHSSLSRASCAVQCAGALVAIVGGGGGRVCNATLQTNKRWLPWLQALWSPSPWLLYGPTQTGTDLLPVRTSAALQLRIAMVWSYPLYPSYAPLSHTRTPRHTRAHTHIHTLTHTHTLTPAVGRRHAQPHALACKGAPVVWQSPIHTHKHTHTHTHTNYW